MELIRGLRNLRPAHKGCVATIGAFDGLHKGHQAVLRRLMAVAAEHGLPSLLITLEPLPREFFGGDQAPARLTCFREKVAYLAGFGIDRMLCIRFDHRTSRIPAESFIVELFVNRLGVRSFVVGDDLRFGADQEGDFEMLRRIGTEHGFSVLKTDSMRQCGERVSSTRLRGALADADFALAESLLGRPYSMSGRVVRGRQLGRALGVPTANVPLRRLRAPLSGVFAVEVSGASARRQPGVANIGTRPTVDSGQRLLLEAHLLDFSDNIYGRAISVVFCKRLRSERRFDSLAALQQRLRADIAEARAYFGLAASAPADAPPAQ